MFFYSWKEQLGGLARKTLAHSCVQVRQGLWIRLVFFSVLILFVADQE